MNSPQESPKEAMQHQLVKMEEGLMQAGAYIAQLQRILWLTVQAAGGTVTVSEKSIPPLWRLDKKRDDVTGELCLTSSTQEPPSEEDL